MDNFRRTIAATLMMLLFVGSAAASTADLYFTSPERQTEINSYAHYQLTLENTGTVEDVYMISSPQDQVQIAPQRVPEDGTLAAGEKATVNVWYDPNPNQEAGTYTFDIKAKSRASGKVYTTEGRVKVIRDHDVSLDTADSKTVCLGEKAVYQVEVTNNGTQAENFDLITRYGKLTQSSISLESGETRTVKVVAQSDKPVTENFNIIAASKTSYAQSIINVEFNAEECWASTVNIQPQSQETAAFTEAEYKVTVRNTGTKDDTFTLTSNVGELERTELQIDSGKTKSTTLSVAPEKLGKQTLTVTAESHVNNSGKASLVVFNGMSSKISFEKERRKVCENERLEADVTVRNDGEATEVFALSTTRGNLSESQVELKPGESEEVELELDTSSWKMGKTKVTLTSTAATFDGPKTSATMAATKQNCHDLQMTLNTYQTSAGENKAAIYQVALKNTGTQENTYNLSLEAPDWISITPESKTIPAGETEYAYIFANVPYQKKGKVKITATAQGEEISRSRSALLTIDENITQKILSDENNMPTGGFFSRIPETNVTQGFVGKAVASIIIGLLLTAGILYHEW